MNRAVKFLLAAASLVVAAAPASAGGDLKGVEPATRAHNCGKGVFNGPYIGATVGYANANADQVSLNNGFAMGGSDGGFTAGALAGYNLQCGRAVFGLETDINWLDLDVTSADPSGEIHSTSYDYYGTLRGRIGLTHENWLFYFTGGLAYAKVDHRLQQTLLGFSQSDSEIKLGYTIGGGLELNCDRFTFRAEVLYVDLNSSTIDYTLGNACAGCRATVRWDDDFIVGRVGVTFKLHREEPRYEPLK